jgi:hypothetical protein
MSHYVPTEQEIEQARQDFLRDVAEIRERYRLKQLRGETEKLPVDWKQFRDPEPDAEGLDEIIERMRREERLPWRSR